MGSTYLDLTNKVLRKLNEVELTSANFASAAGFHAVCKDAVNYAIQDINQAQFEWPFNYQEHTDTLVADQQEYTLPSDFKVVDWSTFFCEKDDALSVPPKTVRYMDYDDWHNRARAADALRPSGSVSIPENVWRSPNGSQYGISPIPDRAYTITFSYWQAPTDLAAHGDTTNIPSQYDKVIIDYAMGHAYDFRENFEMAGKSYTAYRQGLKQMRTILINDSYEYVFDTRSADVLPRRINRWSK